MQNIVSTGSFNSNQVSNALKTHIVDQLNTVFDVVKLALQSMEEFFNSLGNGNPKPGAVFATLRKTVEAIQEVMTSSFLDILAELTNIGIQFVSIISGRRVFGGGVVSRLKGVANIISEFVTIASANILVLLDALLSLLGPFGQTLRMAAGTMCNVVKEIAGLPIIGALTSNGDSIKC